VSVLPFADSLVSDPVTIFVVTLAKFLLELVKSDLDDVIFKKLEHRSLSKFEDIITMSVAVKRSPTSKTPKSPTSASVLSPKGRNGASPRPRLATIAWKEEKADV
jgi:hypothetical protein